jgi:CTP-dependent riboflavin kinase
LPSAKRTATQSKDLYSACGHLSRVKACPRCFAGTTALWYHLRDLTDMNIEGRVVAGCGHFSKRMTAYPEVFRRAIGEVFPGTLNVEVARCVRIREEGRIRGAG